MSNWKKRMFKQKYQISNKDLKNVSYVGSTCLIDHCYAINTHILPLITK